MKFLRRKTGDTPAEPDFNDYVEPFPPARRVQPTPAPGPCSGDWAGDWAGDRAAAPHRDAPPGFEPDADADDGYGHGYGYGDPDHGHPDHGPGEDRDMWQAPRPGSAAPAPAAAPPLPPAAERPVLFPGDAAPPGRPVPRTEERPAGPDDRAARTGRGQDLPPLSVPHVADDPAPAPAPAAADLGSFEMPPPAIGRAAGRAGRAKTRLLGFGPPAGAAADPFARDTAAEVDAPADPGFPVGWVVVVEGPGRGAHFTLFNGVSQIGRGADQTVRLDFGDNSISRSGHALLAYDDEQGKFFLGSGGKVNIVRLNDRPLLSTEELSHNDMIRIGETTLRFVAFCGPDFTWAADRPDADGR